MVLKSYRLRDTLKKKSKKKKLKRTSTGDMITGGVTALIGVGLLSETASAVARVNG